MKSDGAAAVLVAIGTNQPFSGLTGAALVEAALRDIVQGGLSLAAISSMHTTLAWPDPSEPAYTNAVALFYARGLDAQGVLALLLSVEARFGRVRTVRNAPRTLDLDILDFNGVVIEAPDLSLPHPRLKDRSFVLEPLLEVAPDWRHPVTGESAQDLAAALRGNAAPDPTG